ncbi:MAG: NitT/TauT family transport system substrate-binding protein [Chloroflexota bacterium]|nr:NitT/TauT family transport system substrate-binding protein [Chloroflexota bacterium]
MLPSPDLRGAASFCIEPEVGLVKLLRLLVVAAFVVGCGTANPSPPPSDASPSPVAPSASGFDAPTLASSVPSGTPPPTATVRLALDWTPNTDHTGFFVARAKGWYHDAAIDLQVLPYGTIAPENLLAAHQAECGISFQDSMTFAVAAGADIVSVAAIFQKTASAIGVLADGPIQRPRDLDGKTYGSFGYPNEVPTMKAVIKADGGQGTFKVATLDSAAYEALYNKQVDFTIPFTAWEGVQASLRGIKLRYFQFADYGFPEFYQVVLACDRQWLTKEPDAARRFVQATVKGFQFAADNADAAAAILVSENPGVFDADRNLPMLSQEFIDASGYMVDASGVFGTQTLERWTAYSKFLYDQGLLVGIDKKPLAAPLDYAKLFTNDFLR